MNYNPGFDIQPTYEPLGFTYGPDSFGPEVERRPLESIRKSLKDPDCEGPDIVYSIAMDVGKKEHKNLLEDMMLLFGAVTFAEGRLGKEPVRSQGHIHKISRHSGWSPPEVYEIWSGQAVIYMQETAKMNPGRCFAVYAEPGDVVIVPPGWAHATISADPKQPLTFGAWCDREYGFEYDEVRKHNGLAWYPVLMVTVPWGGLPTTAIKRIKSLSKSRITMIFWELNKEFPFIPSLNIIRKCSSLSPNHFCKQTTG